MTYAETLRFLFSLGHELKAAKWDLANMRLLMDRADIAPPVRCVHVAGTNGKGSVCAMMAAGFEAAGLRTGLYTSPHLVDPRERIQINGRMISEDIWRDAFVRVHAAAESLIADESVAAHPSFFETVTAMAFLIFAEEGTDMVVLETGLGGRLDATNVAAPEVTVITPIDFDHEAFLGSSIELIAGEKAGILKAQTPAVFSVQRAEAMAVLERRAREVKAPVTHSDNWRIAGLRSDRQGHHFVLQGEERLAIDCPLAGAHQVENARTAAAALRVAGVARAAIEKGIAGVRWPGRLEWLRDDPPLILDGAHNPAGAMALAAYIRQHFAGEPVRLIFGAMRDKAIDEVCGTLFPLAAEVIATAPDQPRALSPQALVETAAQDHVRQAANLTEAFGMCRERPMATFVTGSLYLVGEARAMVESGAWN